MNAKDESVISVELVEPDHFDLAARWLSEPKINRWLTSDFRGRSFDGRMVAILLRSSRNRLFLVRNFGDPCGLVGLADVDEVDKVAMIWYLLGEPAQGGRGATTAAVAQALGIAFGDIGLENVYAWILETNLPSRRVLEKNGFREFGRMRRAARDEDERVDRVYFDITKDDFLRRLG